MNVRAQQCKDLAEAIHGMEGRLRKLDSLIAKRERQEDLIDRRVLARQERAAKEKHKLKSVAEQAAIDRENRRLRELAHGFSRSQDTQDSSSPKHSIDELKTLATRVRGEIALAKQKLAAL
jgi:hypothetical protein